MLLSTTALYALMSMTVAQRRREFGIGLALGGRAGGVMMTVARRALVQIALGVTSVAGFRVAVMSWALGGDPGAEVEKMLAPWPYMLAAADPRHDSRLTTPSGRRPHDRAENDGRSSQESLPEDAAHGRGPRTDRGGRISQ